MWYVYFLSSGRNKNWIYVGSTNDIDRRFSEHNAGMALSTRLYLPLFMEAYVAVKTEYKARELERYFKSGSGKAILKKT